MNDDYLEQLASKFKLYHIILDTTYLIDSLRHRGKFASLLEKFKASSIVFVTLDSVALEYYKGVKSGKDLSIKSETFEEIVDLTLPTTKDITENAFLLASIYGSRGKDVSSTDYLLGGELMKFKGSNTVLMTRDHGDFPATIFDRIESWTVGYEYEVHTYCFYRFNTAKFEKQTNLVFSKQI